LSGSTILIFQGSAQDRLLVGMGSLPIAVFVFQGPAGEQCTDRDDLSLVPAAADLGGGEALL
jgi:hypothetical protein